jgi:hypothetical protein
MTIKNQVKSIANTKVIWLFRGWIRTTIWTITVFRCQKSKCVLILLKDDYFYYFYREYQNPPSLAIAVPFWLHGVEVNYLMPKTKGKRRERVEGEEEH